MSEDEARLEALWEGTLGPSAGWGTLSAGATYEPPKEATLSEGGTLAPTTLSEGGTFAPHTLSSGSTLGGQAAPREGKVSPGDANYELLEELGRGGMGVIYKARQRSLRRDVAIKTLLPGAASPEKFVAEALVTGVLDHPNIVPVHELGQTAEGEVFLAMKLVGGTGWDRLLHPTSEEEVLKARGLTRDDHLATLLTVCNAIAFAHTRGVLHRDLKPENVMVGEFGEVLVMDWGIAVDIRDAPEADARAPHKSTVRGPAGTPSYMAPEMAEGQSEALGPWTDVYLLGAILHEILTGRPPHTGKTLMAVLLAAARSRPPSFDADVPPPLAEICGKALAPRPADRYPTVGAFQGALEEYRHHRESLLISDTAAAELRALAPGAGSEPNALYARYAKVVARFEQALELWEGNAPARAGTREARLAYARAALGAGDLGLAEAQVLPLRGEGEADALLGEIQAAAAERARARRTAKILRGGFVALLLVIAIGLGVGITLIRAEQKKAEGERDKAQAAEATARAERDKAQEAEERARQERDIAEEARGRASASEAAAKAAQAEALVEARRAKLQVAASYDRRATQLLEDGKGLESMACLLRAVEVAPPSGAPAGRDAFHPGWARASWRRFQALRACMPHKVRDLTIPNRERAVVSRMQLTRGGRYAVQDSGSPPRIRVWDLEADLQLCEISADATTPPRPPQAFAVVAIDEPAGRIAFSYDLAVYVADARTGKVLARLEGHTERPSQLAIHAEGWVASATRKGEVAFWSLEGEKLLGKAALELGSQRLTGVRIDVKRYPRVTFEAGGLTAGWTPTQRHGTQPAKLSKGWSPYSGKYSAKLLGFYGDVLARNDDGDQVSYVAVPVGGSAPALYRQPVRLDGLVRVLPHAFEEGLRFGALDAEGRRLAAVSADELVVIDLVTAEVLLREAGHQGGISGVAIDDAGRRVATVTGQVKHAHGYSFGPVEAILSDGLIRVFDVEAKKLVQTLGDPQEPRVLRWVRLSGDGRFVASSAGEVYSLETGARVASFGNADYPERQQDGRKLGYLGEHDLRFTSDGGFLRLSGVTPSLVRHDASGAAQAPVPMQILVEGERLESRTGVADPATLGGETFASASLGPEGERVLLAELLRVEEDGLNYGASLYEASGRRVGIRALPMARARLRRLELCAQDLVLDAEDFQLSIRDLSSPDPVLSLPGFSAGDTQRAWPVVLDRSGRWFVELGKRVSIHLLVPEGADPLPPPVADAPGDKAFAAFEPLYQQIHAQVVRDGPEAGAIEFRIDWR